MNGQPELSRPNIPFNLMKEGDGDGLLPWSRAIEKLVSARTYWVATTYDDGRPLSVPVWGIWHQDEFFFRTNPYTKTVNNLKTNPHISVHLDSGEDVVIIDSVARQLEDGPELDLVKKVYDAKYRFPLPTPRWYGVKPQKATCYLCRDVGEEGANEFRGSATRYRWSNGGSA